MCNEREVPHLMLRDSQYIHMKLLSMRLRRICLTMVAGAFLSPGDSLIGCVSTWSESLLEDLPGTFGSPRRRHLRSPHQSSSFDASSEAPCIRCNAFSSFD